MTAADGPSPAVVALDARRVPRVAMPVVAVCGLLWSVLSGAFREFVWADLRAGLIDLRGLPRTTVLLIWIGFMLLLAVVAGLLFNDLWRSAFPLLARTSATPGRGALLPVALVPATLFLLAMAWAFALTGALHSRPGIRLTVLGLYLLWASSWTELEVHSGRIDGWWMRWLSLGALAVVPLLFGLCWRARPRPPLAFGVLLPCIAMTLLLGQERELESQRVFGQSLMLTKLQLSVVSLQGLTMPLLLLLGVTIALFVRQAAEWSTAIVAERLPRWGLTTVLVLFLGWRLQGVILEAVGRVDGGSLAAEVLAYAGALGGVLGAGVVGWLVLRGRGTSGWPGQGTSGRRGGGPAGQRVPTPNDVAETVERYGPPYILAYSAVTLAVMVVVLLGSAVAFVPAMSPVVDGLYRVSGLLTEQVSMPWRWLMIGLAGLGAGWCVRRDRHALALYLGIFGIMHLWYELIDRGRPLGLLRWRGPEPIDFWLVTLLIVVALAWWRRGQLTRVRVERLLFLTIVTALLRQTDFIENPFSPFLGFGGIGFIAFSVIWDLLTRGKWANSGTPGLPRLSRILLYLGYALLTVTVINWSFAAHDLTTIGKFTGETAVAGFERFGRPMLYAIFAVILALPATKQHAERTADYPPGGSCTDAST